MTSIPEADKWTGDVLFAEYESTHHDEHDDDDWKDGDSGKGFGAEFLDETQYTEGLDKVEPIVSSISFNETPEIKMISIPSRKQLPIGIGKVKLPISILCTCIDQPDAGLYAEDYLNYILEFARRHDETSDNDIYLIVRRYVDAAFRYVLWENDSDVYDNKYVQVKISVASVEWIDFGHWEVDLNIEEAWS